VGALVNRAIFDIHEVVCRYDDVVALDRLTLRIPGGRRTALLGPNGSGKSTLLMLLNALVLPDAGSVRFDGSELTEEAMRDRATASSFRRRVGFVFQNPDIQLFNPTVFEELAFGPLQLGWEEQRIRDAVAKTLRQMDIEPLAARATYRLSMGEKKRVAIASVLVIDPDVILLDEPTAGLDPRSQSRVIDLMVGWQESGKTIVAATHDLDLIDDIADHVVILDRGKMAAEGRPAELLEDIPLLERTGLVHVHEHRHEGERHRHPHRHRHDHGEKNER
jgi:cobalt/nickel transport system ATP-binding protein